MVSSLTSLVSRSISASLAWFSANFCLITGPVKLSPVATAFVPTAIELTPVEMAWLPSAIELSPICTAAKDIFVPSIVITAAVSQSCLCFI